VTIEGPAVPRRREGTSADVAKPLAETRSASGPRVRYRCDEQSITYAFASHLRVHLAGRTLVCNPYGHTRASACSPGVLRASGFVSRSGHADHFADFRDAEPTSRTRIEQMAGHSLASLIIGHGDLQAPRDSRARAGERCRHTVAPPPGAGSPEAGAHAPLEVSPHRRSRCARRAGVAQMGRRWRRERRRSKCDYPMRVFAVEP